MHADMQPVAPISDANALLHVISVDALHLACVISGVLGVLLMYAALFVRRQANARKRA